jgi:hypothetical protein
MPRSVTFNLFEGGWQAGADADHQTVTLGYKMLLNDYGLVIHHELYHLVAEYALGKDRRTNKRATALNEALADYFAAVALNQARIGNPASRRVKNTLREDQDGERLAEKYHEYGQLISGFQWNLRQAIRRQTGSRWEDLSYADRLAIVAHKEFTNETHKGGVVDLRGWIDAVVTADKEPADGENEALIRRIGAQFVGAGPRQ